MTVRELIELNQKIVDVEIIIRKDHKLLDALKIGLSIGQVPPCPLMVPESEKYINNDSRRKMAKYIEKSINAWDDGRDYWQVKPERIPAAWLDLTVYAWDVWPASYVGCGRRQCSSGHGRNINFSGERISITALPSGEDMETPEPKKETAEEPDNQLNLFEYFENKEAG